MNHTMTEPVRNDTAPEKWLMESVRTVWPAVSEKMYRVSISRKHATIGVSLGITELMPRTFNVVAGSHREALIQAFSMFANNHPNVYFRELPDNETTIYSVRMERPDPKSATPERIDEVYHRVQRYRLHESDRPFRIVREIQSSPRYFSLMMKSRCPGDTIPRDWWLPVRVV